MDIERHDFQDFVERMSHKGYSPNKESNSYVCPNDLKRHWKIEDIARIARNVSAEQVHQNYLQIFSILVWIGAAPFIHYFTDSVGSADFLLPMNEAKFQSHAKDLPELHQKEFIKEQWRFTPLLFSRTIISKLQLDERRIIPIEDITLLKGGGDCGSKVSRVKLHPNCGPHCCNELGKVC